MPKVKVTGVTISTIFDDETKSDMQIEVGTFEDSGNYVRIEDDGHAVYIKQDAWEEVKAQIDGLFTEFTNK